MKPTNVYVKVRQKCSVTIASLLPDGNNSRRMLTVPKIKVLREECNFQGNFKGTLSIGYLFDRICHLK